VSSFKCAFNASCKIPINDKKNKKIPALARKTDCFKIDMQTIHEMWGLLEYICQCNDYAPQVSTASDIKEYKSLLDDGIITQDEFNAKKKQLLGV
jgi:hypothetical protein